MNRGSHLTSGAILSAASLGIYAASPALQGAISYEWAGVFVLAVMAGSTAPDWLEIPHYNKQAGKRVSLISHRTITHWTLLWVLLSVYALIHLVTILNPILIGNAIMVEPWLKGFILLVKSIPFYNTVTLNSAQSDMNAYLIIVGFSIGAVTHCLMDMMTPKGVPVLAPYLFRNFSLRLVRGFTGEMLFLVAFFAAMATLVRGAWL